MTSAHHTSRTLRDVLPTVELALALIAAALWYTTGGAVWYRETGVGLWPVLLMLPLWPLHRLARGRDTRPSGMDACLLVFLISAGVSVWVAYDRTIALTKLGLLLGAIGLGTATAHQLTRRQIYSVLAVLALAGLGLSLYALMRNDWSAQQAKYPALAAAGRALTGWLPALSGHQITPNVAGGMLALLIPLSLPLLMLDPSRWLGGRIKRGSLALRALSALGLALMLLAILLSASRGAWLGLAGALGGWGLWRCLGQVAGHGQRSWPRRFGGFVLLATAGMVAACIAGYLVLLFHLPGAEALTNRLELIKGGFSLAQDYPYTGVGLGLFMVPYSVYTLWIHVGYIVYSHNALLDLLVEQGLVGLGAVLLLWGYSLTRFVAWRPRASHGLGFIMEAALASWAALVIHGLTDNVLYGSRGVLLMFVPTGVLLASAARARHEWHRAQAVAEKQSGTAVRPRVRRATGLAGFSLLALILVVAVTDGHPLTAWHANQGAVLQTRAELQLYDPERFDELNMDQVRRMADLDRAEIAFTRAVAVPQHPTGPRRLAAILLARGDYQTALDRMQASWDSGNRDNGTRLLYGDALVANSRPAAAAKVVRGVPFANERLEGQAFMRYRANEEWQELASTYAAIGWLTGNTDDALERVNDARGMAGLAPLQALP